LHFLWISFSVVTKNKGSVTWDSVFRWACGWARRVRCWAPGRAPQTLRAHTLR